MSFKSCALMALAAFGAASPAFASPALDKAADQFGARTSVRNASFSPSGERLAVVMPYDQTGELVRIIDLSQQQVTEKIVMYNKEADTDLQWCDWASEERLVCGARVTVAPEPGLLIRYTRLLAFSVNDGKLEALSVNPSPEALRLNQNGGTVIAWHVDGQGPDKILLSRDFVPEGKTGSHIVKRNDGLGVELVDLATMSRRTIERARQDAQFYIADEHGTIRLLELQPSDQNGYLKDQVRYFFRPKGGGEWQQLKPVNAPDDFSPLTIDSAQNATYGLATHDGYSSLYRVSLDGSGKTELVVTHNGADIDDLLRIGTGGRVVGASYATDRRQVDFFDPQLKALFASLQKALPGQPQFEILDASSDETRLLLEASSDTNPGMLYSFDKKTHRLEELLPLRPELKDVAMGTMTSVSYPAADGTQIPAYLTLPPGSNGKKLSAIVLPHGGPSARDEWGFDWLVQYFVHLGYAVLQPNFRGSAGYGNDWFQKNGFQSWKTAIGDVNDTGRWLVSQGIADPAKLAIVGWSYGGYAALQSQVVDPDLYKAVVAIAPVTDLDRLREEHRQYTDFEVADAFIGHGSQVEAGSPARHASAFKAPVLLFHGNRDENVGVGESRLMNDRLKDAGKSVRYIEFPDLDHQIDDATQRPRMLREIGTFLDASLKR